VVRELSLQKSERNNAMTVLLLLLTFVAFAAIDYLMNRKRAPVIGRTDVPEALPATRRSTWVDGFAVPQDVRYHQGHSWVFRERKNLARVGADEFAAALAGDLERIDLPTPGHWVRQGQKAWTLVRGGETAEMVSPIEGEVVAVNEEVIKDPSLLRRDPYVNGWLMLVNVPDEESTSRNLIPRRLVTAWMRDAIERLYAWQPQLAGAAAADGGRPVNDVFANLPAASWKEATAEFFLS
jgi:glycine cleavage system H protein